jgi:hypothetical protein
VPGWRPPDAVTWLAPRPPRARCAATVFSATSPRKHVSRSCSGWSFLSSTVAAPEDPVRRVFAQSAAAGELGCIGADFSYITLHADCRRDTRNRVYHCATSEFLYFAVAQKVRLLDLPRPPSRHCAEILQHDMHDPAALLLMAVQSLNLLEQAAACQISISSQLIASSILPCPNLHQPTRFLRREDADGLLDDDVVGSSPLPSFGPCG